MGFIKENEQKKEETDSMENKEHPLSEEAELKACRYCQTMIPKTAKICPNCRKRLRKNWPGIFLLLCLFAACAAGGYYYMTVYSVTEQVSSAEAVAEIEQNAEDIEMPEKGLSAENTVEAVSTETETAVSVAELQVLPEVLESAETSETESEKEPEAKEGKPEETSEAGKEGEPEEEPEADKEGEPEKESEAGKEGEFEEGSEADKEGEPEENPEADKEGELEKGLEVGKAGEHEKETEVEQKGEANEGMTTANDLAEVMETDAITGYTEEEFRDICSRVDYKKLLRSQELYLDAAVTETLTVIEQVDGGLFDENVYYLCKREDEQGITRYYIIRDDREEDAVPILEGDVLRIYGQLFGSCKLPGYLVRTQPVVPALTMVYYDILAE